MKNTQNFNTYINNKATNRNPIRVLYKKVGQPPELKIINDVSKLKKAIITRKLDIIPYETLYIICNNQKSIQNSLPNIILTFETIFGDLLLVKIDKKQREFGGIPQEDILWYSNDLINKSPVKYQQNQKKYSYKRFSTFHERDLENCTTTTSFNFDKELITVLENIKLVLISLLKK